jgi:hypothetical protein
MSGTTKITAINGSVTICPLGKAVAEYLTEAEGRPQVLSRSGSRRCRGQVVAAKKNRVRMERESIVRALQRVRDAAPR